jgi:hypothetical protein
VVDRQPKFSLIISADLRRLITSLVEKYGNAIIALQLAAMINPLKDKITSLPMSARTHPLKTLVVTLFSIVQA